MEIVLQILSIVLVLLAFTGALCMVAIFATIMMVHNGGFVQFGYQEDDSDEIINNNNNEEEM